jgi:putative endonuclease
LDEAPASFETPAPRAPQDDVLSYFYQRLTSSGGGAKRRLEGRTSAAATLMMGGFVYILLCSDGSYYVGCTSSSLEKRLAEHEAGIFDGYTAHRRPLRLVFHQAFENITDAIAAERRVKGWRRERKEALIRGDYAALPRLARRLKRTENGPQLS